MKFDLSHWLMAVLAFLGGGTGLWGWLAVRSKGKTDLVAVAQEAAKALIGDLRTEVDRAKDEAEELRGRMARLEEDLIEVRREHGALILANETLQASNDSLRRENQKLAGERDAAALRIADLEGELRQSKQIIEAQRVVHGDGEGVG